MYINSSLTMIQTIININAKYADYYGGWTNAGLLAGTLSNSSMSFSLTTINGNHILQVGTTFSSNSSGIIGYIGQTSKQVISLANAVINYYCSTNGTNDKYIGVAGNIYSTFNISIKVADSYLVASIDVANYCTYIGGFIAIIYTTTANAGISIELQRSNMSTTIDALNGSYAGCIGAITTSQGNGNVNITLLETFVDATLFKIYANGGIFGLLKVSKTTANTAFYVHISQLSATLNVSITKYNSGIFG